MRSLHVFFALCGAVIAAIALHDLSFAELYKLSPRFYHFLGFAGILQLNANLLALFALKPNVEKKK